MQPIPAAAGHFIIQGDAEGIAPKEPFSENCCVLNVFTPDLNSSARRPVMLYIHGGGFQGGSGFCIQRFPVLA